MNAERRRDRSRRITEEARTLMPGGVSSPVRALHKVGAEPIVMEHGEGCWLTDVDGNRYLDLCLAWGPLIHGHAHPPTTKAIQERAAGGFLFGTSTAGEVELLRRVRAHIPGIEKLRLVNSGTEAAMSAVRLARAASGRDRIIKFDGCYHGHADFLLVKAGSGALTLGVPDSAGVPAAAAALTLSLPYNDPAALRRAFREYPGEIAAVLVEPVAGNMGVIPPVEGWLECLRECCDQEGTLLVFDEVITGFRLAPGSAAGRFSIRPDLWVLGKILGGGLPVGAYGGAAQLMDLIAPSGPVYQAGTLSGNPLATAAGCATLDALDAGVWSRLEEAGTYLASGLRRLAARQGLDLTVQQIGSMLTVFFAPGPIRNLQEAERADTEKFAAFWRAMAEAGVYLPPSQFETAFVSTVHGFEELDMVLRAAEGAFARL